jgi:pimeloyl-ACP methyl ester carboxylesterase
MITRITINGLSALKKPGIGTQVVLLHGISSDAESFRALMNALPNPCLAFDLPGYGGSQLGAYDFLQAIEGDFILLGSSLGAILAGNMDSPRVKHVILVGAALGYGQAVNAPLLPAIQARIDDIEQNGAAYYAENRAARLIHNPESKPEVLASVKRAMRGLKLEGLTKASHLLNTADLLKAKITAPLTLLVGDGDLISPIENSVKLQAAFPHATLYVVKGAGHALVQEDVEAVARWIPA